jgi:ATP-dependent Clp protease, protease subunit
MATPAAPQIPKIVYAAFCGGIEQATARKVVSSLTLAMGGKVEHVHLLFQSAGGYVGDGVFLYNFFRSIPIKVTLYNVGQVSSAGVVAYLGAKSRQTTRNATFMLHRSTNSPQFATAAKLQHVAKTLVLDDERTEAIIHEHVTFPPKLWKSLSSDDIYISGEEAVKFGIAQGFDEFAPPAGTQVFNFLE